MCNTKSHFRKVKHCGLHRDDGMAAFDNKLSHNGIQVENQIPKLRKHAGRMWLDKSRREKPMEQNDPNVCYAWTLNLFGQTNNGNLQFQMHLKPNQQLKHTNADIIHAKACFTATPTCVYKRLSRLTTIMETSKNLPPDKTYRHLFQALQHAGLVTMKISKLIKQLQNNEEARSLKQTKKDSNNEPNRGIAIGFCIGHCNLWSKPVHSIIKTAKDEFNLQWSGVSVSHQRITHSPTSEKSFNEMSL